MDSDSQKKSEEDTKVSDTKEKDIFSCVDEEVMGVRVHEEVE